MAADVRLRDEVVVGATRRLVDVGVRLWAEIAESPLVEFTGASDVCLVLTAFFAGRYNRRNL